MAYWYVSAWADGGGDGSKGSPWSLDEAITADGNGTVGQGDTVWFKADGVYQKNGSITITAAGTTSLHTRWEGYTSAIGDNGRATFQRTGGSGYFIVATAAYRRYKNFTFDMNSEGSGGFNGYNYILWVINCEFKNNTSGYTLYPRYNYYINCYIHDCTAIYGYAIFYHCIIADCTAGAYGIIYVCSRFDTCIMKNISGGVGMRRPATVLNSIFDNASNGAGHFLQVETVRGQLIWNNIFLNHAVGAGYAISLASGDKSHFIRNNNFYNVPNKCNDMSVVGTYHELDPQFKDPANLDYRRTGSNLDDLGFSHIGLQGLDYGIDIGPDQGIFKDIPVEGKVLLATSYVDRGVAKTGTLDVITVETSAEIELSTEGLELEVEIT